MRFLLVAFLFYVTGANAETLTVSPGFRSANLGLSASFAYDATAAATVQQVRAGALSFSASTNAHPNFGYRRGAEWVRLELDDARGSSEPLILTLDYGQTDRVEFFSPGTEDPVLAGDHVARSFWPIDYRSPAFPLASGTKGSVFIRVSGEAAHQVPLRLMTQSAFEEDRRRDVAVQSLYFGALLAIAAYNLLVALFTASRAYGTYVGFLLTYALFQAGHLGLSYQLIVPVPAFIDFVHVAAIASALAFTTAFAQHMVPMHRDSPKSEQSLKVIRLIALAVLPLYPVVGYSGIMRVELPLVAVALVLVVTSSTVSWRRGDRTSGLFLLAWSTFLLGSILAVLRQFKLVPVNADTDNAQQVGSLVEFLLLSFALADRIKELQAEVIRSTQLAHDATKRALDEQETTAQELRRLDRLKDEFFSNTSHELRTPVHAIVGLSEGLLDQGRLSPHDKEIAETIARSGRRLATIVASVVDFASMKRGDLAIETKPTDLTKLLREEVKSLTPGPVSVTVEEGNDVPLANADAGRLRQAFAHIIGNAHKFTREGHIKVRLHGDDDFVHVSISDTGCGITADRIDRVFDGFDQGDGSSTRSEGGIGIGLALAKRIVDAHGGTIAVASDAGVGTTVTIRIPSSRGAASTTQISSANMTSENEEEASHRLASLVPPKPQSLPPRAFSGPPKGAPQGLVLTIPQAPGSPRQGSFGESMPPPSINQAPSERIRLLVADDDPINRRVIQMQLGGLNFELVEAVDGIDALEKLESEGPFDGVLLDVMMPRLDGYGVCRELRKTHPANDLPVLMLTAKTRVQDLVAGFEAGANDYVPKPFAKAELLARIRTHVTMSRTSQAMSRFVPRESLDLLGRDNVVDVRLGDTTEREIAVLFADVRGFTQLAERLGPSEIFALLNLCYAKIGPEVRAGGGFVDKYIGDAVMALFPDGPSAAVNAAIRMQETLRNAPDLELIHLGIGIHVGPTMLGTLGEPVRFETTVISDAVNIAARLETFAKRLACSILVSSEVAQTLEASVVEDSRPLGRFALKGKARAVDLVEVFACDSPELRASKRASREAFADGREAFRNGSTAEARMVFHDLVLAHPHDGPLRWWKNHVEQSVSADLSDDERDVVRLDEK